MKGRMRNHTMFIPSSVEARSEDLPPTNTDAAFKNYLLELESAIKEMQADSEARKLAWSLLCRLKNWNRYEPEFTQAEMFEVAKTTTLLVKTPVTSPEFNKRSEEFGATLSKLHSKGNRSVLLGIGASLLALLLMAATITAVFVTAGIAAAVLIPVLGVATLTLGVVAGNYGLTIFPAASSQFAMAKDMKQLGNALQNKNKITTTTNSGSPKLFDNKNMGSEHDTAKRTDDNVRYEGQGCRQL